jgi:hypothetical protein
MGVIRAERNADTTVDVGMTDGLTATSDVKTPAVTISCFQAFYADSLNVFLMQDDGKIPFETQTAVFVTWI